MRDNLAVLQISPEGPMCYRTVEWTEKASQDIKTLHAWLIHKKKKNK